jgi:uncharacterized membrane protein YedE/YeeE
MNALLAHWPALFGGMLIGLSSAWLLLASGRIAGCSGIAAGLLGKANADTAWKAAFLLGLLLGPVLLELVIGHAPAVHILASIPVLLLAGLLVGFGTRMGSGCTSGHGVSGMARLSRRSFAAVGMFMATAIITVFLVRHVIEGGS